ncbi:MAG: class I SAM-dependent methyltransferase [Caldimicrobium sp.]
MAHKFDPKKIEKLEDPKRLKIFNPDILFKELGLNNFKNILDFGVGSGFYLPYLAKILKPEGKIYAIDLQKELLEYAKNKSEKFKLSEKIEFLLVKEKEALPFSENFFDFVYLAFTFHELDNPDFTLREIKRILIPGGKLLLIDWNKKERDMGPPPSEVFDYEEIENHLMASNLKILKTFKNHPYVFIFLAEK